ncbi:MULTISPECIES: recombination regulator RecX [unclassified Caballeronia]|jgi:regulatory protein|uniref:recombination regulator RecX n=1 Tax=unclassified Caballeronia TaxID=2646786 RepID=UPI002027C1A9|nr:MULTISPECIES: recombination regulator RecX [unclassified Caballeronia]MDR5788218.1 recombination regulator RecX [Caballeronia sp. LP003]MDR5792175.1 recombination regulator RecX [Caballeronia sp. LZ008]
MQTRRLGSKADPADNGTGDDSDSVDRYERSSERRGASSKSGGFRRSNKERAGAKSFASAHRVFEPVKRDESSVDANDRAARLEQARALLKQATAQPKAPPADRSPPSANPPDPFEDADPFEPFEQCVPSEPSPAVSGETVYSRSSQRTRKTSANEVNNPKRPQRSLKGRALAFLSRREYSRAELSRKLRPYVEEAAPLESLLDSLERDGWLSNERFVESVVHRRASRMGGSRIISELKRHAVGETLISETADKLAQSETARARAVWEKKYGVPPETPAERAKQARFLAARGFSSGTIGKILKGGDEDWSEEIVDD